MLGKHLLGVLPDNVGKLACTSNHIGRHVGLELTITGEDDVTVYLIGAKLEDRLHGPNMVAVLPNRVMEFVFFLVNDLRPVHLIGLTENPTRVILGLDDKHAIWRDNNMVDLRGASVGRECDVVDHAVTIIQLSGQYPTNLPLTTSPLGACGVSEAFPN